MQISEKELQIRLASYLKRYFEVEMEVWSIDYKKRIDIAMFHKSDISHFYPIGIEIKTFDKKTGSDAGKWINQASNYSKFEFIGYGKMLIIVAPQFSENVFAEGSLMYKHLDNGCATPDHNVSTFLGQFNLGEFQKYNYIKNNTVEKKYRIVYNGLLIWDEKRDIFRPQNIKK